MRNATLLAALALLGCDQPQWKGWVYPDRNDLTDDIPLGAFPSLEECRAAARGLLRRVQASGARGDYECGYKCKLEGDMGGLNICERTER